MEGALSVGGQLNDIILPALTATADSHPDDLVRLGRLTDWEELDSGEEAPVGQKLLLVDNQEVSLLEVREIVITQPAV
jgi:type VI secretion system protein ImpE